MADSLDDFFAKKDKKRKNKSQAVALSAEALVRELEVGSKQNEYSSRRDGKTSTALELLGLDANDNDWKDFEEIEKRDYTGLKVKEMSIQDQEEELRRFNEQVEQAPELIPWKSKEETVAAIISSKDLNQFPPELLKNDEETGDDQGAAPVEAPKATTSGEGPDNKTEGDPSKAVSSSKSTQNLEQPSDGKSTPATDTTPRQGTPTPSSSQADGGPATTAAAAAAAAAKKDGDSGSSSVKTSAKYVPPHERVASDVKVLEPVKLIKLTGPRFKASNQKIDIKDEKSFPSLG